MAFRGIIEGNAYPSIDPPLVSAHYSRDVILNHFRQLSWVGDSADPAGQLTVPDEGMTTDDLSIGFSEVHQSVRSSEVELATSWLEGIPLHAVLGRKLAEICLDDSCVLCGGEEVLISGCAEVRFALGLEEFVDRAGGCLSSVQRGGRRVLDPGKSCGQWRCHGSEEK